MASVRRTTKLIGAGMPRTGTLTQEMALEMLGLGPCYHMVDVLSDLDQATLWERSMRQTVWAVPHGESLVRLLSSAQAHVTPPLARVPRNDRPAARVERR